MLAFLVKDNYMSRILLEILLESLWYQDRRITSVKRVDDDKSIVVISDKVLTILVNEKQVRTAR